MQIIVWKICLPRLLFCVLNLHLPSMFSNFDLPKSRLGMPKISPFLLYKENLQRISAQDFKLHSLPILPVPKCNRPYQF